MDTFKGQDFLKFVEEFKTDDDCKEYLSKIKWDQQHNCVKCGHEASQIRKDFSRTCNKCSPTESVRANTLFHKVTFGIRKAFFMCFEMSTRTKSLSASYVSVRYTVTVQTVRLFMHKMRETMKSSESYPMDGGVHVDEFVLGGKEGEKVGRSYDSKKKKAITALQLTEQGKIRRTYARTINGFSAKFLAPVFKKHIDVKAKVTTDLWKGYRLLAKAFVIDQLPGNKGANFLTLHTMIHQIKSWIRTTYSWVSDHHVNRYFDEFYYRVNRSQAKIRSSIIL